MTSRPDAIAVWRDALHAAALFAVDPIGLGGVSLRAMPGPARDRWLAALGSLLGDHVPVRRVPHAAPDERLLGGLDLAGTLRAGRPVYSRGLLAEAAGGVCVLAMAERLSGAQAARFATAMDTASFGPVIDRLEARGRAGLGVVALDEGLDSEEAPPLALRDRQAFILDLHPVGLAEIDGDPPDPDGVRAARARLAAVDADDEVVTALCASAMALGISAMRAPMLALRTARAAAALDGREQKVSQANAALAARLVLAPRATRLPMNDTRSEAGQPEPTSGETVESPDDARKAPRDEPLRDMVLAAAAGAIPADLMARFRLGRGPRGGARTSGRSGTAVKAAATGRPVGARRGELKGRARLDLLETLRAAAPWQPLRVRQRSDCGAGERPRIAVRREDFRIKRIKGRRETLTVFAVDASGSMAVNRLAEAKGAVELLLADCYVRRDEVALVAFRGRGSEVLLPPTRSLVRAKRCLAGLPGGGGTPLAAGIEAARLLAEGARRRGQTPLIVLLSDGRANVGLDGMGGRERARADAEAAARAVGAGGFAAMVVDTAPRPREFARRIASQMDAGYIPLPHADAAGLSEAVRGSPALLG